MWFGSLLTGAVFLFFLVRFTDRQQVLPMHRTRIMNVGLYHPCSVFVDANGNGGFDPEELMLNTTDGNGVYYFRHDAAPVVVYTYLGHERCYQSGIGAPLPLDMATLTNASVMTPLTSLGIYMISGGVAYDDVSPRITTALGLLPFSIWTFDSNSDNAWSIRMEQMMCALAVAVRLFEGGHSRQDITHSAYVSYGALVSDTASSGAMIPLGESNTYVGFLTAVGQRLNASVSLGGVQDAANTLAMINLNLVANMR